MKFKYIINCLFLVLSGFSGFAQEFKNEFGFKTDNDAYLFTTQDRYYTNGLFINYRHATNQQKLGKQLEKVVYEISAGQRMYNPISGQSPNPQVHDRPFAAYLYVGGNVSIFSKKESVLKIGAELGTVGPDALGEDVQKTLHKIVGFYEIKGWEYQIANELTVNLSAQYNRLLHRSETNIIDFSFEGYANVGTTFNGAGAGVLFRAGRINQLFNSASTNSVISNHRKTEKLVKSEFFFYAKPQLNYVAYDATVSGSLFNDESPITFGTKPLVFAQQVGFNYSSNRFTVDYSLIFKSKEIKSTAKPHQFGSISMYYRF